MNSVTKEQISAACEAVAALDEVWDHFGTDPRGVVLRALKEAKQSPDEYNSYDGAGIYIRKGATVWRMQYGDCGRAVFCDAATAHEYMAYIRQIAN